MQLTSRPSNEAEEIERAEQAVELSKRELNRRLELARRSGEHLLAQYRDRLKPLAIVAAAAVGVVAVGVLVVTAVRRHRGRGGWLSPANSQPSRLGQVLKTAGIWLLRRALTYAAQQLIEHTAASASAMTPQPAPAPGPRLPLAAQ
jgi:hypothetical protein